VYEFTWQLDAMQFWDRFEGRRLFGSEFHYPECNLYGITARRTTRLHEGGLPVREGVAATGEPE
jgi:hypothetical protein